MSLETQTAAACVFQIVCDMSKTATSDTTNNHITQPLNPSEVFETAQNELQDIMPSSSQGKDVCNVYITFDVTFQKNNTLEDLRCQLPPSND